MNKIGFIGLGQMGGALIKGFSLKKDLKIFGFDLDTNKVENLKTLCNLIPTNSPEDLIKNSDYIFIAVKPHQIKNLCSKIQKSLTSEKCIISVATGTTIKDIQLFTKGFCPIVRVMPNICAINQAGSFALCFDDASLNETQKKFLSDIFNQIGSAQVFSEKLFDAYAAVIGSGPAYIIYFMMAMIDSAVSLGFSRDQASFMVKKLFEGTSKVCTTSKEHLNTLKELVTSPAGSTIQALNQMDLDAVKGNIIKAIKAAYNKNVEIGKN